MSQENKSLAQFASAFLRFEVKHQLFSFKVKGHIFWDYIRYNVSELILHQADGVCKLKQFRTNTFRIKEILAMVRIWTKNLFSKGKQYDILLLNYPRVNLIEGRRVNIHTYPLAKCLEAHYSTLVLDPYDLHLEPANYPCDTYCARPLYFFARLRSLFVRFNQQEKAFFDHVNRLILDEFGCDVNIPKIAMDFYALQICLYSTCLKLLKKFRPRIVIYSNTGSMKNITEAAHHLGICTIDLQHGVVSPVTILFHYLPETPFSLVSSTLPDYIFTYGNYWNPEYRLPSKAIAVGFPYLEMTSKNGTSSLRSQNRSSNIIVLSVLATRGELAKITLRLSELLPETTIYYKLRTEEFGHWRLYYPSEFLQRKNIIVIDNDDKCLYDFFEKCSYQFSSNSMSLYEGLAHNLVTFILKAGCYEEMSPLYKNRHAFLVSNAEEIAYFIQNKVKVPCRLEKEFIFKKNSLRNSENAIEIILKKENNATTH